MKHRTAIAIALALSLATATACGSEPESPAMVTITGTSTVVAEPSGISRPKPQIDNPRTPTVDFVKELRQPVWVKYFDDPLYEAQLICQNLDQNVSSEGIEANLAVILQIENTDSDPADADILFRSAVSGLCPEHQGAGES